MVKVTIRHGRDVAAAEDADFELRRLGAAVLAGDFGAGVFEVVKGLIDDGVGADVGGDRGGVTVVGDEFLGGGEVDAIDVGVTEPQISKD